MMATGDFYQPGPRIEAGPIVARRQGIIPCGRCAFFVPNDPNAGGTDIDPAFAWGECRVRAPKPGSDGFYPSWQTVSGHPSSRHGCGQGLLREHAAPLPPETKGEG